MFETESNGNGAVGLSSSDQKITYRQLFTPVKVKLMGEEYLIQPPSPFMGKVIADYKLRYLDSIMAEVEAEKARTQAPPVSSDSQGKTTESIQAERLEKTMRDFNDMFRIFGVKKRWALKYIQLILLDAKKPDWKERYDDFPPDDELDKIVTIRKLERMASEAEMVELMDIYEKMQEPTMEKNFERWGVTEMLMRSLPGRASGGQSQSTSTAE